MLRNYKMVTTFNGSSNKKNIYNMSNNMELDFLPLCIDSLAHLHLVTRNTSMSSVCA